MNVRTLTNATYLKVHAPKYLEKLVVRAAGITKYRFWQAGPGYDVNVTEPQQLYALIEYIHNNPIDRGLVETASMEVVECQ